MNQYMSMYYNGQKIAAKTGNQEITRAAYDLLPTDTKNNGTAYFVTDDNSSEYEKLVRLSALLGDADALAGYGDGTVIGCLNDIIERLGGISMEVIKSQGVVSEITFNYDDTPPTPVTPVDTSGMSDDEIIDHIEDVIGDEEDLNDLGFTNVVSAIISIYQRLAGITFEYNDTTSTVTMNYSSTDPQ